MRDDQIKELEKLHEMMTDDMLRIGFAAVEMGFETPEERGDKVWLYKGFNQCGSAVGKVEQVLGFRKGVIPPTSTDEDTQRKYEKNLTNKAKAIIQKVKEQTKYN